MTTAARFLWAGSCAAALCGLEVVISPEAPGGARSIEVLAAPQPAEPSGQTLTRLADGRWLIVGGETNGQPLATARIVDPRDAHTRGPEMPLSLSQPRAWHSATILPDGTVLIAGGIGANGLASGWPETFNPAVGTFRLSTVDGAAERSGHTATLLTDGRVLIAGGNVQDEQDAAAEIWTLDAQGWTAKSVAGARGRKGHTAMLLPDGRVMLIGGRDARGSTRRDADAFDPATGQFSATEPPRGRTALFLAESLPRNGAEDVNLDTRLTVRFSTPLAVDLINDETFQLWSGDLPVALAVVPAEGGRLVFLAPAVPLEPARTYRLSIAGAVDEAGARLAAATITFSTKSAPRQPKAEETVTDAWQPNARNGWRTNRPASPWESLPPLVAPHGVTAISGRVLTLNGRPLPGVTLSMEGARTESDRTGRFLLQVPTAAAGRQVLEIEGSTANWPGRTYGFFEYRDVDRDGRDNCAALHDLDAKARSTACGDDSLADDSRRRHHDANDSGAGAAHTSPDSDSRRRRKAGHARQPHTDPGGSPAVPWSARR